ncbi:hypothetical protein [Legionella rowbothamii]|uniref:hypothetical protein n=1 Tax=Legionella rowbothamii TaxID=96229 RepID=UPI0010561A43|nr:hypothetical protein [Legionella rowbothamii]
MKKSWEHFESISYLLESNSDQFIVKDSKSSSMALSIALININRAIQGQVPVLAFRNRGVLRIDGSFNDAPQEEKNMVQQET